jgi:hypothetical protein
MDNSDRNDFYRPGKIEVRVEDPRRIHRVMYEGKRYLDITELFTESFHNGMTDENVMLSKKKILSDKGDKK